jgi:hypothetical protein
MTVRVTQSNATGFEAVSGDPLAAVAEDGASGFTNYIPTVFEAASFSVDLNFEGAYAEGEAFTYQNAISVTALSDVSAMGLTITALNSHSLRVSGSQNNAFPGTFYQFLMPNYSLKVLPPTTTETYLSLVQYHMPAVTSILKEIQFTVVIPPDPLLGGTNVTETVTMNQWVMWRYASAKAGVLLAVSKGNK